MTSDEIYKEAFVWIWLAGETEPVVAGKLEADIERSALEAVLIAFGSIA